MNERDISLLRLYKVTKKGSITFTLGWDWMTEEDLNAQYALPIDLYVDGAKYELTTQNKKACWLKLPCNQGSCIKLKAKTGCNTDSIHFSIPLFAYCSSEGVSSVSSNLHKDYGIEIKVPLNATGDGSIQLLCYEEYDSGRTYFEPYLQLGTETGWLKNMKFYS